MFEEPEKSVLARKREARSYIEALMDAARYPLRPPLHTARVRTECMVGDISSGKLLERMIFAKKQNTTL